MNPRRPAAAPAENAATAGNRDSAVAAVAFLEERVRSNASRQVDLPAGSLLNMELSHLAFAERIIDLASDERMPLLERARFISILGEYLDQFFLTRVAGFKRQSASRGSKQTLDGLTAEEQLRAIGVRVREMVSRVEELTIPDLVRDLRAEGIEVVEWNRTTDAEKTYLRLTYQAELESALRPAHLRPGLPFPHVRNLRLAFLVRGETEETDGDPHLSILEMPGHLPRLLPLPGGRRFVALEQMIRSDLPRFAKAGQGSDAFLFRVTRAGNLPSGDGEATNDVEAVSANVALRPFQPVIRIEIERSMPAWGSRCLLERLGLQAESQMSRLTEDDIYALNGPLDLARLGAIADLPIDSLRFPVPRRYTPLENGRAVMDQLSERDVLVRFPRHSFRRTIERFIQEAASDDATEEIWVTLYRTNRASRLIRALRRAHANGKTVGALVELKASFDERRNIEWARKLESVGIRVLYGSPSLKVHAKIACVVRREHDGLRPYSYVATGNLNAETALTYTDIGLLTADRRIGEDIRSLFLTLAGDRKVDSYPTLIVAPFNMRERFLALIGREVEHARAGRPARLTAKLNGIADREIVAALYAASQAGVEIDLLVRGLCAVRPGVKGLSERIRVVALAGRYLEHSRIFRFNNAGAPEYYIGSGDLRGRNLSRRVEVVAPITDPRCQARLDRILESGLNHPDAWDLRPDGRYERRTYDDAAGRTRVGSSTLAHFG